MDVSERFPVNVGLIQCSVMSPWFFNVYMHGVVRYENARLIGKELKLLRETVASYIMVASNIILYLCLLFADDTALVDDSEVKLYRLMSEFGTVRERRKFRVNGGKNKVMR